MSAGVSEREVSSLRLPGDGSLCRFDAHWVESVPFAHPPLQDVLCAQPPVPLLPVSALTADPVITQLFYGFYITAGHCLADYRILWIPTELEVPPLKKPQTIVLL